MTFEYDVFISCSDEDEDWVARVLLPRLEETGLRVCVGFRDFMAGRAVLSNMQSAIQNSRHTLLVMTPAWEASEWTLYESLLARAGDPAALNRRTIPLHLQPCDRVPEFISMLTHVDFTQPDSQDAAWRQLFVALDAPEAAHKFSRTPFQRPVFNSDPVQTSNIPFHEPYYRLLERDKDVESILETMNDPGGRAVVLITGIGGIGKTALAAEVVRRCARAPGLPFQEIAWESAKQELFVDSEIIRLREAAISFPDLVNRLGCQIIGPDFARKPEVEQARTLRDSLYATPCLIIVDNLETMDNAQEIVTRLRGLLGQSRALITSRHSVAGDAFQVSLGGLSESSSIAFLREEGRHRHIQEIVDAPADALAEIHRVTGGMPLAIKLVVSQAQRLGLDVALTNLEQAHAKIYFFIFFESWKLLSDAGKKLLLYIGPTSQAVGRGELELALEMTGPPLDRAIEELIQLSLLNPVFLPGLRRQGYTIHQLTRYFVVNDLPDRWAEEGLI